MYLIEGTKNELMNYDIDLEKFFKEKEIQFILKDGNKIERAIVFKISNNCILSNIQDDELDDELDEKLSYDTYNRQIANKLNEYYGTKINIAGFTNNELYVRFEKNYNEDFVKDIITTILNNYYMKYSDIDIEIYTSKDVKYLKNNEELCKCIIK